MTEWVVNYDGWVVVEANTEDEALALVNAELSKSGLTNDGDEGEWFLVSCEEKDIDTKWQNYLESMVE